MTYDEDNIAELLSALPPAPEAWVRAAQELPTIRRELDDIVARDGRATGVRVGCDGGASLERDVGGGLGRGRAGRDAAASRRAASCRGRSRLRRVPRRDGI